MKPYSVDVLATVAVALAATAPAGRSRGLRWAIGMGFLGGLAWVSNVVPFVLAGSGIALGLFCAARGSPGVRHLVHCRVWSRTLPAQVPASHRGQLAVDKRDQLAGGFAVALAPPFEQTGQFAMGPRPSFYVFPR